MFTWTAATGALEYSLWIGTTPGGLDLYAQSQGTSTTSPTMPLPAGGVPLYISRWTRTASGWSANTYTVTAAP